MNEPIDVGSIVLTQDPPKTPSADGVAAKQQPASIMPPVDIQSITFQDPKAPLEQSKPPFQRIVDFALNPAGESARLAGEFGSAKGQSDASKIEFLPLMDDTNKVRDSSIVSNITGFPQGDVEQHYDELKALYHLFTGAPQAIGEDLGARVHPVTTEGVMNTIMTPAVIAATIADPGIGIARLIAFGAVDHIVNPKRFIPKNATPNEAASIRMIAMGLEALAIGGVEHGVKATDPFVGMTNKDGSMNIQFGDLLEKYFRQTLEDNNQPTVITLHPDALDAINKLDAQNKMARKNDVRRQNVVDEIAGKLLESGNKKNPGIPDNVDPLIIRDAKQQALDDINQREANGEKLKNKDKHIRFLLQQDLAGEAPLPVETTGKKIVSGKTDFEMEQEAKAKSQTIAETLGIDKKTSDAATSNRLSVKVKAEDLVKVATNSNLFSQGDVQQVFAILNEHPGERVAAPKETGKAVSTIEPGSTPGTTATGEMKPPPKPKKSKGLTSAIDSGDPGRIIMALGGMDISKSAKDFDMGKGEQRKLNNQKLLRFNRGGAQSPDELLQEGMEVAPHIFGQFKSSADMIEYLKSGKSKKGVEDLYDSYMQSKGDEHDAQVETSSQEAKSSGATEEQIAETIRSGEEAGKVEANSEVDSGLTPEELSNADGSFNFGENAPKEKGNKVSGVSKDITKEAIEAKLLKEGITDEDLAKYGGANIKEQAQMVADLMQSDIERAKRIATGKEAAPTGLRTEALFSVMRDYAMDTNDGQLALDLAKSPVATELSSAGSKLRLSQISDPDSATAKIREIMKVNEEATQKKLKGKTPEKAKAEIKKNLTKAIEKSKPKQSDIFGFLDDMKC